MRLWTIGSSVAALLALTGVVYQQVRIGGLQDRLEQTSRDRSRENGRARLRGREDEPEVGSGDVDDRIAALELIVTRLSRLAMRGTGQPGGGTEGGALQLEAADADLEALREDVDALLVGEGLSSERGRTRLREAVREVQEQMSEERRREHRQRRQTEREERLRTFASENRLSASQLEALMSLLSEASTQREEIFEQVRAGEKTRDEARTEVRAAREQTDEEIRELLDAPQYEAYEQLRQDERGGGGEGGGGGRRGGGGF